MITYFFRTIKDESLKEIAEPRSGVWVYAVDPTDNELNELAEKFSLDLDIVIDAKDIFEVPRMERVGDVSYFFTRFPYRDKNQDNSTVPILIIIGGNFVITISMKEVPQFKNIFENKKKVVTTQKTKFFIEIMNIFTESFNRELLRFQKAVHKDKVRLRSIGPRDIERLVEYETNLNGMIDALVPTNTWLQQVTSGRQSLQFYNEDIEIMQDLVIANSQVVNSARMVLKTIQNIRSAIEAIMTSRLNNALRVLTVLTILLTIPLVVTSMYGMNVKLPFQDSPSAFFFILAFSVTLLLSLFVLFRKKDWL